MRTLLLSVASLAMIGLPATAQHSGPYLTTLARVGGTSAPVINHNGNLYGVVPYGGSQRAGSVFKLARPTTSNGRWTLTTLYNFTGGSDGGYPFGTLMVDKNGSLFGTTSLGGLTACIISGSDYPGCGTVFKLAPPSAPGGAWTESVLYAFQGGDGESPTAGLVADNGGVLYGTTIGPNLGTGGNVFSLTPPAKPGKPWTEAVLHNFQGGVDGAAPDASLTIGSGGVLYGTTLFGGGHSCGGRDCGTVFQLTPPAAPGGTWTETILHSFAGTDGEQPTAGLTMNGRGILYGTASYGGKHGGGVVFELAPPAIAGGTWTQRILHNFAGGPRDAVKPNAGVIFGPHGVLYGAARAGGPQKGGALYSLTPPSAAGDGWTETLLFTFEWAGGRGFFPQATLTLDSTGALFGTTDGGGTVFRLIP